MYNFIDFFRTDYLQILDQYKQEAKESDAEPEESKQIQIDTTDSSKKLMRFDANA